jgi:hypothetical protein
MAKGNQAINDLADQFDLRRGQKSRRKHLYRKVILGTYSSCQCECEEDILSPQEIRACQSIPKESAIAVQSIEGIRWWVIESHTLKMKRIVKSKLRSSKYLTDLDSESMEAECVHGFLHCIYSYTNTTTPFINFMTIVLHNWLGRWLRNRLLLAKVLKKRVEIYQY